MHKIMEPTRDLKSYLSGVNGTQQGYEAELGDAKQYIFQVIGDKLVSLLHKSHPSQGAPNVKWNG
jgi:hypothetical protein